MNFQPKSEKEIREAQLWQKGEYDFECVKAENAISGSKSKSPGTAYIKLTHRLFSEDGRERLQNAVLHPAMDAQLRHFCVVGNLLSKYESGTLQPEDCEGVSGRLKLKVKEDDFGVKNEVADYVVPKEQPAPTPAEQAAKEKDDVPFN